MSRYRATNDKGELYAYGYDRPLAEYFLQKGEVEIVGNLGTKPGTNGHMLEALRAENVEIPADHYDAISMDLPF